MAHVDAGVRHRILLEVMGCGASLTLTGAEESHLVDGERRLRDLECKWSRFLPDSDVTRLNLSSGKPVRVDPDTCVLVRRLMDAWLWSDGLFDPTLLPTLTRLGYRVSTTHPGRVTVLRRDAKPSAGRNVVSEIEIDHDASTIRLPRGLTLDPGGLGKGLAADVVVDELMHAGVEGVQISIGGDLACAGTSPSAQWGWRIAVEDPFAPAGAPQATIGITRGGVATSSRMIRRWVDLVGIERHHLIDPRTLAPTTSDVAAVTVVAGTGAWAEMLTTLAMVDGSESAIAVYNAQGIPALVTCEDGTRIPSAAWSSVAA